MPQILVPGTAQAVLSGTIGANTFNCIFHYKLNATGVNWSLAQLQSLCDGMMSGIATTAGVQSLTNASVTFQQVKAVDLGTTTPFEAVSTHIPLTGAGTGEVPNNVCVLVSGESNQRYRGGKPRTYMPPGANGNLSSSGDSWVPSFVGNYQTAFVNMHDAVFNAVPGCIAVVVRYNYTYVDTPAKKKYLAVRDSLAGTPQILTWLVKPQIGTQRRRVRVGG